jgi:hypothetical protein
MKGLHFTAKLTSAGEYPLGLVTLQMQRDYMHLHRDLAPAVGEDVLVEIRDGSTYTSKMNRLFHVLIRDLQRYGVAPYWGMLEREPRTFEEIKTWAKVELGGAHVERVGKLTWVQSWSEFTKEQALQTIDSVINWLIDSGCHIDNRIIERNELGGLNA